MHELTGETTGEVKNPTESSNQIYQKTNLESGDVLETLIRGDRVNNE